jgi:hypothetical protein
MATLGLAGSALASSHVLWDQDFTDNTDGWLDGTSGWSGSIVHNAADGTATVSETSTGPFSRFDGYRSEWPGDYVAEIDVYLDPAWETGTGFDYAVASSGSDGAHQRDFIFHVGVVEGVGLLVNGSNNADFTTNPSKLLNDNGGAYHTVTAAGWYTLQHVFRYDGGVLAVDLNLLDAGGNTLWTATRTNADDTIGESGEVGGNRYAWFTHIEVPGGVEVDNHQLYLVVLAPESKEDCKNGGFADFGFDNQGQCIASVVANEAAGK